MVSGAVPGSGIINDLSVIMYPSAGMLESTEPAF